MEAVVAGRELACPWWIGSISLSTKEWKKRPFSSVTFGEIASLRKELRREKFDLCVDMQGSVRSAVIGRMAKARRFVGSAEPREAPAAWFYDERVRVGAAHVVEQGCELLGGAVGEVLRPARVELPLDEPAEEACASMLDRLGLGSGGFVLLAPTAGWGAKQWPTERYGAVAAELGRRGVRVAVNAMSEDDPVAQAVVRASGGAAVAVPTDVPELIPLTRRAGLVIAGDTGPLHLAAALERPVVALFGPTDPARNGPYGAPGLSRGFCGMGLIGGTIVGSTSPRLDCWRFQWMRSWQQLWSCWVRKAVR